MMLFCLAGFLTLPERYAFPSGMLFRQWRENIVTLTGITVAGTVPDSHRIPFYAHLYEVVHHQNRGEDINKFVIPPISMDNFCIFVLKLKILE
jgi:hypothetical protein